VNVPDRASEWFDDARGLSFFPALQGRAIHILEKNGLKTTYTGGQLIQNAPLFPALGNHEVMGRYSTTEKLKAEYTNTLPRNLVSQFYPMPRGENEQTWIKDHSYNSDTYEEIFSLPTTQLPDGGETQQYYALSFGDVRLVSLYVTQIWRSPELSPTTKGRYRESRASLSAPETWGYGQHIFEDIRQGSPQYNWLAQELASDAFKNAKYKIVMLHHPPHTLGGNIVPAFTDPVMVETRDASGTLQAVQYEYPQEADYIVRDLVPLLESAKTDLVFYGHSHLWNRFVGGEGTHFLETSNVGNSYGAHTIDNFRKVPTAEAVKAANDLKLFQENYRAIGDPNGLTPVEPTLAPIKDDAGKPLPYIASNDITSFSILNTGSATISSYYFDTRNPSSEVVKFDEFKLTLEK
ncbi:MAG: metallophosphoesterase, partial [Cyanobacteria bacterium J06555_13]